MKVTNAGLRALTTSQERKELRAVGELATIVSRPSGVRFKPVLLRRTFNMTLCGQTLKFWRVMSQDHVNANSDLSVAGLRQWGIIP